MTAEVSSYAASNSRRSHRKSRLGCGNCKKRRVKCDEIRPECSNCVRHSIQCDYRSEKSGLHAKSSTDEKSLSPASSDATPTTQLDSNLTFYSSFQSNFKPPKRPYSTSRGLSTEQPKPPSVPDPCLAVANKPFQFTATDMALFHHFITSPELGAAHPSMQNQLSRLGFSSHYLLRLLLAYSGFHITRSQKSKGLAPTIGPEIDYYAEAERHYEIAVRETTAAVPLLNKENAHALYAASIFIFICSIAKGPRPGEFLAFRTDGQAGCLSLFLGVRSILEICNNILSIDIAPLHAGTIQELDSPTEGDQQKSASLRTQDKAREYDDQLRQLRHLITAAHEHSHPYYESYCGALDMLHYTHQAIQSNSHLAPPELFPQVFGWLYTLPDNVLMELQQLQPLALVLYAFFVVLLKELDSVWFIRQWPEHILSGIYHHLDDYHRQLIQWPMEQLGLYH